MPDVTPTNRSTPSGLTLISGGWELLDRIEPLWNQQRDFHFQLAPQWKQGMTPEFGARQQALIAKGITGHFIAVASIGARDIGYAISTIDGKGRGELDSLFVDSEFRNQGVGDALMRITLAWFAERGIDNIAIELLACNEGALRFYARYGYEPRSIVMKRPAPPFTPIQPFQVWRVDDNGNVFAVGGTGCPLHRRSLRSSRAQADVLGGAGEVRLTTATLSELSAAD